MTKAKKNTQQKKKNHPPQHVAKKKNRLRSFAGGGIAGSFYDVLKDPFNPNNFGARVPDPYAFPTAVYHVHGTQVLGPSSSVSSTSFGVAFLPNPNFSMFDVGGTLAIPSVTTNSMNIINAGGSGNLCYGATDPGQLSQVLSTYRVVSWGLKISNLMPELSATGRIIIAPMLVGDTVPNYGLLASGYMGTEALTQHVFGSAALIVASSAILGIPGAVEFAVQDLLHGDIELGCCVSGPGFFNFKSSFCTDVVDASYSAGDEVVTINSTGITNTSLTSYKDTTRCAGGVAWVIYAEGLPQRENNMASIQVEYVYHLEGNPQIANYSGGGPCLVPSIPPTSHVGTSIDLEVACSQASSANVMSWIKNGAQFLNNASKAATGKGILSHAATAARGTPLGAALSFAGGFARAFR